MAKTKDEEVTDRVVAPEGVEAVLSCGCVLLGVVLGSLALVTFVVVCCKLIKWSLA